MPGLSWVNGMCGFILGEQDAFATSLIKKIVVTLKKHTHTIHLMTDILRFFSSPPGCIQVDGVSW